MPIGGCSLLFEPFKKCVSGDLLPVAFFLFCSGPLAPIVKLLIGDPPGLDPRKAPLVFLAVSLESVIVCLSKRPLLQGADVAAARSSRRQENLRLSAEADEKVGGRDRRPNGAAAHRGYVLPDMVGAAMSGGGLLLRR